MKEAFREKVGLNKSNLIRLDALNPKVLHELVKKNVEKLIDMDSFKEKIVEEKIDKEKLRDFEEGAIK